MISSFIKLSKDKSESLITRKKFLSDGLFRLNSVSNKVNQLSIEAESQQVQVKEKEQRAKEAMDNISKTMTELSLQSTQVDKIQKELSIKETQLKKQKEEIDQQLSGILPLLKQASENVAKLDSRDISEVRSFSMPPQQVRDVLEAILLLMGERDTSWQSIRKVFSSPKIKDDILHFDPHEVSQQSLIEVNKAIEKKSMSFDYETVKRSSKAAAPLSQWVKAMASYCSVLRDVKPLENEMKKCDNELNNLKLELKEIEDKKNELNKNVDILQDQYKNYTSEAEHLRISLNEIEEKQKAATNLLNKLSDEQKRWTQQLTEIENEQKQSTNKLLMSSIFITICGSLNENERLIKMKQLKKLLQLKEEEEFNFSDFINTKSEILELKFNGFPSDELSLENIQIINQSTNDKALFIIDPTEHIIEWLEHSLGPSCEILSSSHPRFQHQVTLAIRFGKKLIIKEVDSIPLCLYPYLEHDYVLSNGHLTVRVGDKYIDINPEFKLFLVTRNSSIQLKPQEKSLVSIINFSVTKTALKMQLLTLAISTEMPKLEQQHQEKVNETEQLKIELGKLESSLLDILAAADPNTILSNKELINSLDDKKKRAIEVEQKIKASEEFQAKLQAKRTQYQPLANTASALYFAIDTLSIIHIFGLLLLKTVYPKMFPEIEWQHLLHQKPLNVSKVPNFIPQERLNAFQSFAGTFPKLFELLKFDENSGEWEKWMTNKTPELNSAYPIIDGKNIQQLGVTPFQRILILQALRPDRVLSALQKLVISTFKNPKTLSLRQLLRNDDQKVFIFIVTPGSDPTIELKEIANEIENIGQKGFLELALGECNSQDALSLVRQASRNGQWALIKNVHLDITFLQQLEKLIPTLLNNDNNSFKLILSTEVINNFPIVLLQSSIKIAYESPPGLLNQMKRILTLFSSDWFNNINETIRQNIISLVYLHSILQERRAFIPIGWSKFFEFTQSDLNAAIKIIEERKDAYDVIKGLLETTVYGSCMDSIYDKRVLKLFVAMNFPMKKFPLFEIPKNVTIENLSKLLKQCNVDDGPNLLGLAMNANVTVTRSNMEETFHNLSLLSSAIKMEKEKGKNVFKLLNDLEAKYPSVIETIDDVELKNNPAIDFLEMQRNEAHLRINEVRKDLKDLNQINNTELLPVHLRAVSNALKNGIVPIEWCCDWIENEDVFEWLEELFVRTNSIDSISKKINSNSALKSSPIALFSTLKPAAFVSAVMQTAVHTNKIELNDITLKVTFEAPESGAVMTLNISDLMLQAAMVKNNLVTLSDISNNDLFKLGNCYLNICTNKKEKNTIKIPIFESLNHEKLVAEVEVETDNTSNDVILASVAFVLDH
ncbi:Cytoplasmic dynein 2 heavy chain 1 [Histomonas meleagridis]|uniref:Cytoplasmic dynein 2 heavy chain 1 n=1 Tax=Histomonas meleagridis TaxID=135588 RepID=UPI00355A741D|nr:Cytoplasmic dynein 2 heavy chain 1 [Histomonas meleagridis]KAH0800472.1 Cytoplasmic dynein 2 heavy chain 1 [Histomonas meleagridis]